MTLFFPSTILSGAAGRTLGSSFSLTSAFGDMTVAGGNAAAIDGDPDETGSVSSGKTGTSGYVGGVAASAKRIYQVIAYGGSDTGFFNLANPSVTLNIYGKSGSNPSSATDGTLLGTTTFTDTTNESAGRTIVSTDQENTYDRVWVVVSVSSSGMLRVAEIVPYEAI